jgi:hypothetical protein
MPRIDLLRTTWTDDPLAGLAGGHPRLLLDAAARSRIAAARPHPVGSRLWEALAARGAGFLDQPVRVERTLSAARASLDLVYTVGLLAQVTGEARWAERAIAEAEALAALPDWNPADWLTLAETMHAVAIVLDWCAPWLKRDPGDRRAGLLAALVAKGLDAADHAYACRAWWWRDTANWNAVCNGAVLIACLVAADERPGQCRRLAGYALQGLPLHLGRMAPDGAHEEGPGYWAYSWRYLSTTIGCLRTALGHDHGLGDIPWLAGTAAFRIHHQGPTGRFFAWADSYREAPFDPNLLWLARNAGLPGVAAMARRDAGRAATSLFFGAIARALIDWSGDGSEADMQAMPLTARFRGAEVCFARTGWDDGATWAGLKGGDVQAPHAHLDLGAVVAEAAGVRWLDDPGGGDYGEPGYWHGRPDTDGGRWRTFACGAGGHCTVLIDGGDAHTLAQMHLEPGEALAVVSDTAFADRGVTRWRRELTEVSPGRIVVTDTVVCTRPVRATLVFITPCTATASGAAVRLDAGNRSALLNLAGCALQAVIEPRVSGDWTRVAWTVPLPAGRHRLESRLTLVE